MGMGAMQRAIGAVLVSAAMTSVVVAGSPLTALADTAPTTEEPVYYLENPWTQEGFFTPDRTERDTMRSNGWDYVHVSFYAPRESSDPVYRLFNPWTDDHLYTRDANEYQTLAQRGWLQEGAIFYSDEAETAPIYRLYAPWMEGQGSHIYTTDSTYYQYMSEMGWHQDGSMWYGLRLPTDDAERFQGRLYPDLDGEGSAIPGTGAFEDAQGIVAFAKQFIGWPYVGAGESPEEGGFDCSGLVQYVYRHFGIELPRTTWDQIDYLMETGLWKTDIEDLRPGAIIAMDGGSHVGIFAGYDPETGRYMMVDAASSQKGVVYREIYSYYWNGTFMGGANLL